MSNVTNQNISKAIEKETGYAGVRVSKCQGCCRFYIDEEYAPQGIDLSLTDAQYVNTIKSLSLEQWVEAFVFELKETNQPTKRAEFFALKQGSQYVAHYSILDHEAIWFTNPNEPGQAALFKSKEAALEFGNRELSGNWSVVSV
jgi:hypothetical protein